MAAVFVCFVALPCVSVGSPGETVISSLKIQLHKITLSSNSNPSTHSTVVVEQVISIIEPCDPCNILRKESKRVEVGRVLLRTLSFWLYEISLQNSEKEK